MRRPFCDTGAVLASGVMLVAPAASVPLAAPSERALLELARGELRPALAKAVRFSSARERTR